MLYILQFITTTDINECGDNDGGCSQICNNTEGSYACLCNDGYELDGDGKHCLGKYLKFLQCYYHRVRIISPPYTALTHT